MHFPSLSVELDVYQFLCDDYRPLQYQGDNRPLSSMQAWKHHEIVHDDLKRSQSRVANNLVDFGITEEIVAFHIRNLVVVRWRFPCHNLDGQIPF